MLFLRIYFGDLKLVRIFAGEKETKFIIMQTVFNPIQLQLLQMFSCMKSEQELKEFKQVLSEYYIKKVEERANNLWENMSLDQQKLDAIANIHERLPYR